MKRLKVLIMLFVCMAVLAVALVLRLLARLMGLVTKALNGAAKLLIDTGIAIQWAAIDLTNAARGWWRWAVR